MTKENEMSTPVVRVQEKGQVTIPLEIRRKLNLRQGDFVTFIETENGVVIKPAEVMVTETLDRIGKVLKEKGIDLDELIESGREIRQEIYNKKYAQDSDEP
jgi:AbrB family looped-hinge helix DNA binding protein